MCGGANRTDIPPPSGEGDHAKHGGGVTALLTVERARELRRRMTPPETRLWLCLRGKRLAGLKFRRQHPIGAYILDFYCASAKLAVEVDGQCHEHPDRIAHDRRRTVWLREQNIRVIRLSAESVRTELGGVLEFIALVVGERVRLSLIHI